MRYMASLTAAIILLVFPFGAQAAVTARISVPKAGEYYCWFVYAGADGGPVQTVPGMFKGKKTTVDLPVVKDAVATGLLFVLDARTGNEAMLTLADKPDRSYEFKLASGDFDHVRRVRVRVTSASSREPAAAAAVKLEHGDIAENPDDKEEKNLEETYSDAALAWQTQALDPSAEGMVEFTDVKAGPARVTVEYGDGKTSTHDVEIPLDREEVVPAIEIPVVGEIETLKAVGSDVEADRSVGEPSGRSGEASAPGAQGINFATALVGLVLFVGIVYVAYLAMRNRGVGARRVLEKLGVDLPQEQSPAAPSQAAQPVDPSVCPFCGGRKDPVTGACACSVGTSPAAVSGTGPRLVAVQGPYAGGIYNLEDGTTIGREESNGIALALDNTVSRRHARISVAGGEFTIYDDGSSNGTFVNGVRVTEQVLHSGDEVQVGSTMFRFEA